MAELKTIDALKGRPVLILKYSQIILIYIVLLWTLQDINYNVVLSKTTFDLLPHQIYYPTNDGLKHYLLHI